MRLIDADYLAKFMAFVDYAEGLTAKQAIQLVKEADGIDAIPVEWIESQVDKGKWAELIQRWAERKEE